MGLVLVRITERLVKTIEVNAETEEEAIDTVETMWKNSEDSCILTAEDFVGVEFDVEKKQEGEMIT